jgi:drug/metabolite transporter (DMT)-like permease
MSKPFSVPVFVILAALLVVSWSSGFVGIRFANQTASIPQVLLWRNFTAGILLLPFAVLMGPRIPFRAFVHQIMLGIAGMFLYLASFAVAIGYRVPTGLVALIADLVPLAIGALSQPILKEPLSKKQWIGTAIAIIGVVYVSLDRLSLGDAPFIAYLIPVAGMLLFALMTVLQKRSHAIATPIHQSLAIQCLVASACYAPWAWHDGGILPPANATFIIGILWLVALATYLCYSVYYVLLRHYPPARVASLVYLSPPMTMVWATVMFGEPLTLSMALGTGITFVGVIAASST